MLDANKVWHIWSACLVMTECSFANVGKSPGQQLKGLCNQVGSYYPQRENFRLTPEVKDTFTGKLRSSPREFCGQKVSEVAFQARKQRCVCAPRHEVSKGWRS